jgi:O-acetyl-ADP-ribose deacetylase (regulator of RNase III)
MFNIVKGDLIRLSNNFDAIAHGCNCFCTMGAGIAKQIKLNFPEAYEADLKTESGCKRKLGTFSKAGKVYNIYTQYSYSRTTKMFEPWALKKGLEEVAKDMGFKGKLGVPLIGGGLAKGSPEEIKDIMKSICDKYPSFHITLVLL